MKVISETESIAKDKVNNETMKPITQYHEKN